MKGEIFNIFENFIVDRWGAAAFEEILSLAQDSLQTDGVFVGPGTYPDSDFFALVGAACQRLKIKLKEAVYQFGIYSFPKLAAKLPGYLESFDNPKDFLLTVHDVIHVEVKKIYKDATPPKFYFASEGDDILIMEYISERKLYDFVEGLIEGVARAFQVQIHVERKIVDQNEGRCRFQLTFESGAKKNE